MTVSPTSSGTEADQDVVPEATPASPLEVVQATCVTPAASLAVPLTVNHAEVVETMVVPGTLMARVGGVPLPDPEGVDGGWVPPLPDVPPLPLPVPPLPVLPLPPLPLPEPPLPLLPEPPDVPPPSAAPLCPPPRTKPGCRRYRRR